MKPKEIELKLRFVEILLLISSIVVSINAVIEPQNHVSFFVMYLFFISAIIYHIIVSNGFYQHSGLFWGVAFFVSSFFSTILLGSLADIIGFTDTLFFFELFFTAIAWLALLDKESTDKIVSFIRWTVSLVTQSH